MRADRTAAIAQDVVDAMSPALTQDQRLTAINHALALDPVTALAVATTLGQALIETLGTFGLNTESVIADLQRRANAYRPVTGR